MTRRPTVRWAPVSLLAPTPSYISFPPKGWGGGAVGGFVKPFFRGVLVVVVAAPGLNRPFADYRVSLLPAVRSWSNQFRPRVEGVLAMRRRPRVRIERYLLSYRI